MMASRQEYRGYWLWPVLDDDGKIEYWDVHHPDDRLGEGDPLAQGFATKVLAQEWITTEIRERSLIDLFDRMTMR